MVFLTTTSSITKKGLEQQKKKDFNARFIRLIGVFLRYLDAHEKKLFWRSILGLDSRIFYGDSKGFFRGKTMRFWKVFKGYEFTWFLVVFRVANPSRSYGLQKAILWTNKIHRGCNTEKNDGRDTRLARITGFRTTPVIRKHCVKKSQGHP